MRRCLLIISICVTSFFINQSARAQVKGNPQLKRIPTPRESPDKSGSVLSNDLRELSASGQGNLQLAKPFEQKNALADYIQVQGDRVLVDVSMKGNVAKAKADLAALGFIVKAEYGRIISGSIPITSLSGLQSSASLKYVMPAYRPLVQSGNIRSQMNCRSAVLNPVNSQGDTAQGSYIARKKFNVTGKGVKVGLLSDSYNSMGGASKGIRNGELPGPANPFNYKKPVQVLEDFASGTDEGRALAEIVHDVSPGAEIAFNTAQNGQAAFAKGIEKLADAGCKVIADDVVYFAEPFFQDGIIAQAIDKVKGRGVSYFSSAGNRSVRSYESVYRPSRYAPLGTASGTAHNFSSAGSEPRYFQPMFVPSGGTFILTFQYDQPFYSAGGDGADSDYDIYLLNDTGAIVAAGTSYNIQTGDPLEVIAYNNNTESSTFFLLILKFGGPDASRLKYVLYGDGAFYLTDPAIPGILAPALVGHANADGAIATAAAFYLETPAYGVEFPQVESFSSIGGVANYFNSSGERISPLIRQKPEFTAPDGVNTSFFDPFGNGDIFEDEDNYPNFFGTSAAVPHAAGVAALMIQAQKLNTITPSQIKGLMEASTYDMDNPETAWFDKSFDFATGYGLLKAEKAVGRVRFPNIYILNPEPEARCTSDPGKIRRWKISNNNPFDLKVHWIIAGSNLHDDIIVPGLGAYWFSTKTVYVNNKQSENTLIVDWDDNIGVRHFESEKSTKNICGQVTVLNSNEVVQTPSSEIKVKPIIAEVFPNPSAQNFNLYLSLGNYSPAEVQVMSIEGKIIYRKNITAQGVFIIEASTLKPGVYLLQVRQGTFSKTIRLIKQ